MEVHQALDEFMIDLDPFIIFLSIDLFPFLKNANIFGQQQLCVFIIEIVSALL